MCDFLQGQSICCYSHWFEFINIPNCYTTSKGILIKIHVHILTDYNYEKQKQWKSQQSINFNQKVVLKIEDYNHIYNHI